jgi:thiosulfate/3-mercaptopyruvate sulfurtransferase
MRRLPHPADFLITPEGLTPGGVRLLDCRSGPGPYAAGHLEGALHADLERFLSGASDPGFDPARGGRHPLPPPARWAAQLGRWGITPDTSVVVYDDACGGSGGARAWWMLRASGHTRVAVLDGGLQAAREAGLGLSQVTGEAPVCDPYPVDAWHLPVADLGEVAQALQTGAQQADSAPLHSMVLDVRAAARWRGEVEPLDPVAGRIPGTRNLPFTENLGPEGRFRSGEALRAQYLDLLEGLPPERLIVHCGSGVTACHTLLALELAGLPGASLYVGSYSEWCRSERPIGKG